MQGLYSAFWNRFGGNTPIISQLCCASVTQGFNATFGGGRSEFRDEWVHSRFFLAWGNNPAVSNQGYMEEPLPGAEEHGARLVTIDPRLSETAALSDRWVQIRPGTDSAYALGMVKVLLDEGLFDEEYVAGSPTRRSWCDSASAATTCSPRRGAGRRAARRCRSICGTCGC